MKKQTIEQQIYEEVYSAHDLVINESKSFLENAPQMDEEKFIRLQSLFDLGFSNAEQVKEFSEMENKKKEYSKRKEFAEYYRVTYPLNRFIDFDSVKRVCEKYGLLLCSASKYIADIPEKNQKEIVDFRVKRKDKRTPYELNNILLWYHQNICTAKFPDDYFEEKIRGEDILIMAPEHKLNTEGMKKVGHILKNEDPIVLQPVRGGYLIVTSWGLEAGDEEVVNSINN